MVQQRKRTELALEFITEGLSNTSGYRTPSMHEMLDELANILGMFKMASRRKIFSQARSFDKKQQIFTDFLDELQKTGNMQSNEFKEVSNILLKLENVLSSVNNTALYSDKSKDYCEALFYNWFTIPTFILVTGHLASYCKLELAETFNRYLKLTYITEKDDLTKNLKANLLSIYSKNDKSLIEKSSLFEHLRKVDNRSFLSINTIQDISDSLDSDGYSIIAQKVAFELLAARCAYHIIKTKESFKYSPPIDPAVFTFLSIFTRSYICNPMVDNTNDTYLSDNNYIFCIERFLDYIAQEDPASYLKNHGTSNTARYKNGVFLSYLLREQILWDMEKRANRIDKHYLDVLKESFNDLNMRQTGQDGADIGMLYIILASNHNHRLVNNALQPAISLIIDNLRKNNIISLVTLTPFEIDKGMATCSFPNSPRRTVFEINILHTIQTFNERVKSGVIKHPRCNPFKTLNEQLIAIQNKERLSKRAISRKPIRGLNITLYDAIKFIDYYLLQTSLSARTHANSDGIVVVESSYAGEGIDYYLKLSNSEKLSILKKISPDEYAHEY
jgi:hypothetical protein